MTNTDMLKYYGFTFDNVTSGVTSVEMELKFNDYMWEIKKKMLDLYFNPIPGNKKRFRIRGETGKVQTFITPFRLRAYKQPNPRYLEIVGDFNEIFCIDRTRIR